MRAHYQQKRTTGIAPGGARIVAPLSSLRLAAVHNRIYD